jgi:mannosyl-oligosaccharide alpha-1,2-mannosidase
LVDALDTLWIMDLKEEFAEAVEEVHKIDFTTSLRAQLPLFETTIRYLGGLLGAYDISGGKERILVDKAVELADVLLGAFDTPNRMPLLFYSWKPKWASKPHRAGTRNILSELGSLSMEFTRLAQITKEQRFYDAVARITNEFEKWQMDTKLPGMWPVQVDASGCNTTVTVTTSAAHVQSEPTTPPALPILDDEPDIKRKLLDTPLHDNKVKRQLFDVPSAEPENQSPLKKGKTPAPKSAVTGQSLPGEEECEPQGLASPPYALREMFTLGSLSDSLYEYMPKMYMLLGGLNPQYKTMHERAMKTVKANLLYRPMTPDGTNVLFTGKMDVSTRKGYRKHLTPIMTHLTCFVGGMFGVGAKIFERPEEIDIASKLTDGCIWAYDSTNTGIMPEVFHTVACADRDSCPWNETAWHEALDPYRARRLGKSGHHHHAKRQLGGFEESFDTSPKKPSLNAGTPMIPKADEAVKPAEQASSTSTPSETQTWLYGAADATFPTVYTPPPPLSHEEYVANRIRDERLPAGFSTIDDRRYILRPEAIESVFIMSVSSLSSYHT